MTLSSHIISRICIRLCLVPRNHPPDAEGGSPSALLPGLSLSLSLSGTISIAKTCRAAFAHVRARSRPRGTKVAPGRPSACSCTRSRNNVDDARVPACAVDPHDSRLPLNLDSIEMRAVHGFATSLVKAAHQQDRRGIYALRKAVARTIAHVKGSAWYLGRILYLSVPSCRSACSL